MVRKITILIVVLGLIGSGCKKKSKVEEETPPPALTPNQPAAPALIIDVPQDADGMFMASIIPYKFPNNYVTSLGNASVFIFTSAGNYNYIDGGIVKCNDSIIPKLSGGSYYFYGTAVNGQSVSGIDYAAGSSWNVSGNSTTGVPQFTFALPGIPTNGTLTSTANASKSAPYNGSFALVSGADYVTIILSCDSITLKKTLGGSVTSWQFTAEEMAGVKKANSVKQGSLSIIPYKIVSTIIGGKKYYFVNSNTSTWLLYIGQ